MSPLPAGHRSDKLQRACREHGIPVTVQRRAVFEAVCDHQDHPTADQIHDRIRSRLPGVSRTTVYRILDTFVRMGLITRICHPGSAARFDPKTHQHHHLVCLHCGNIIDLEEKRLNRITWPDVRGLGFEIRDYHIHFRGICARCRRSLERKPATTRRPGGHRTGNPQNTPARGSWRNRRALPRHRRSDES